MSADPLRLKRLCKYAKAKDIEDMFYLTKLDLSYEDLLNVPPGLSLLTQLIQLTLWNNQLSSFPAEISCLTGLRSLSIGANRLTSLPAEISCLACLNDLTAENNLISSLPAEISCLTVLSSLAVYNNLISSLPPEISSLTYLRRLGVWNNPIEQLPPQITALTNLHTFVIVGSGRISIKRAPRRISSLPCWGNKDDRDYRHIQGLKFYETIDSINEPDWTPTKLQTRYESLSLYGMKLTTLPQGIGLMQNLTYLCLEKNKFIDIPDVIFSLRSIVHLNISNNEISNVPEAINLLQNLEILDLTQNQILYLPTFHPGPQGIVHKLEFETNMKFTEKSEKRKSKRIKSSF